MLLYIICYILLLIIIIIVIYIYIYIYMGFKSLAEGESVPVSEYIFY